MQRGLVPPPDVEPQGEPAMIHRLEMEGYRGFPRYTLANLSRVNLLVGKNNSGKSSILEAVHLLADGGDLRTLEAIARRRGETMETPSGNDRSSSSRLAEISHFFHGHEIKPGSAFTLRTDDDLGTSRFEITVFRDGYFPDLFPSPVGLGVFEGGGMILVVDTGDMVPPGEGAEQVWYLSDSGASPMRRTRSDPPVPGPLTRRLSCRLVGSDSIDRAQLSRLWDDVLTDGGDDDVIQALRILEPDLTSIAFLSGERSSPSDPRGGVVVGFRGESQRRPLGSYGEGMRRLLTLAVVLQRTKNGVLLIDEVDTGLHYSILGDVWSLIVETAVRNNVQVFLTTHSLDCLRALGWFCGARPDLADQVSVQKIERRLDEAVAFDASKVQIAVEQDIEVR